MRGIGGQVVVGQNERPGALEARWIRRGEEVDQLIGWLGMQWVGAGPRHDIGVDLR